MKQRSLLLIFFLCAIATFAYFVSVMPTDATVIFVNGKIYTLDAHNPIVEAIAIRGYNIVGTGTSADIARRYLATKVIDLQGKPVVPGFIDGHAHVRSLGDALESLHLAGAPSPEAVAAVVADRVSVIAENEWVFGRGWDQNLWPNPEFPTKEVLDRAAPHNPVVLGRVDGHAIWVNSRALELAGISRSTVDPVGGRIVRDPAGNPTGVLIDRATELVARVIPQPTIEQMERSMLRAMEFCIRHGLTQIHDMGVEWEELEVYRRLAERNQLPLRVYAAISVPSDTWENLNMNSRFPFSSDMLTVRSVKLYIDGALGSRGAALFEEYSDDPGNRGLTFMSEDDLVAQITRAVDKGFQPCVHAIGDRGNHIVLNAFERVLNALPNGDYRFRIEHCQTLAQDDIGRFAQLGILPSMQPTHATSDMYWAEARLGPDRIRGAYAWRSLLDSGTIIIGGSDFPVESPNPLWGFYAAITRSDHTGYPADGWYGREKMRREEALKAFTAWAAYGAFQENRKGTLTPGKLADMTVLSRDIMSIPPREVLETDVEMTIIGGRIVFARQEEHPHP